MLVVLGRWAFVMLGRQTLSVFSRRTFAGFMCCCFGSGHVMVVMAVVRHGRCAAHQAQGQACRDNVFHSDFPWLSEPLSRLLANAHVDLSFQTTGYNPHATGR